MQRTARPLNCLTALTVIAISISTGIVLAQSSDTLPPAPVPQLATPAASTPAATTAAPAPTTADPVATAPATSSGDTTYLLRYQFQPGETLQWDVKHQVANQVTVAGLTRKMEATTSSAKLWRYIGKNDDGDFQFEHLVDDIVMHQKIDGESQEFDSRVHTIAAGNVPATFKSVAERVGVPLFVITINDRGIMVHRKVLMDQTYQDADGMITLVVPEQAIPVGHSWKHPEEIVVRLEGGDIKKIRTQKKYTLKSVQRGVATIQVAEQVLTPVDDPQIEAQLIQKYSTGTLRFDIETGRVLDQQMDLNRTIVGAKGPSSSLKFRTRFTEELVDGPTVPVTTGTALSPAMSSVQ